MKTAKEIYMYAMGGLIVFCFFTVVYILIFVPQPPLNVNILNILLGILAAKFSDVIGYFFGSSKSSADKTAILANPPEPKQ